MPFLIVSLGWYRTANSVIPFDSIFPVLISKHLISSINRLKVFSANPMIGFIAVASLGPFIKGGIVYEGKPDDLWSNKQLSQELLGV